MIWQVMLSVYRKLLNFIRASFLFFRYFLNRRAVPVTWGNKKWFEFEDILLFTGKLSKTDTRRADYAQLPYTETACMLEKDYKHYQLRKKLDEQIIEFHLQSCINAIAKEPICIMTSGGTASGKTSAVDYIVKQIFEPQDTSFLRIDYDAIKYFLPEYKLMLDEKIQAAAKYVQGESVKIGGRLFKKAYKKSYNIIYEKTLDALPRLLEDIHELRKKHYEIVIIATHIREEEGQSRASKRYAIMGRFIPPEIISKIYSGVPKTLFEARNKVDRVLLFDNNEDRLKLMFYKDSKGAQVINQELYDRYLISVGADNDLCL